MSLSVLQQRCSDCRQCPHGSTRKQMVFAKGDPLSTLCFVGEAPGADEDEQGIPFVGDAGRLLDKQIQAMRDYATEQGIEFPVKPYICNVVKCRPPGNRLLKDGSDAEACKEWLWQQLRLVPNLRVIVALGRVAAQTLTDCDKPIGQLRGFSFCRTAGTSTFQMFATYHPAYLLRQPNRKDLRLQVWADLKLAVEALR